MAIYSVFHRMKMSSYEKTRMGTQKNNNLHSTETINYRSQRFAKTHKNKHKKHVAAYATHFVVGKRFFHSEICSCHFFLLCYSKKR